LKQRFDSAWGPAAN